MGNLKYFQYSLIMNNVVHTSQHGLTEFQETAQRAAHALRAGAIGSISSTQSAIPEQYQEWILKPASTPLKYLCGFQNQKYLPRINVAINDK